MAEFKDSKQKESSPSTQNQPSNSEHTNLDITNPESSLVVDHQLSRPKCANPNCTSVRNQQPSDSESTLTISCPSPSQPAQDEDEPWERESPPPLTALTAHFVDGKLVIEKTSPRVRFGDPSPSITAFNFKPKDMIRLRRM